MAQEFQIIESNKLPQAFAVTDNDTILIIQGGFVKRTLPSLMKGPAGDSVYLRVSDDGKYIQWEQGTSGEWENLIAVADITGMSSYEEWEAQNPGKTYADYLAFLQKPATDAGKAVTDDWTKNVKPAAQIATTNANNAATAANTAAGTANTAAANVKDGKTPQYNVGTVNKTTPGGTPVVTITSDGTDTSGNPKFKFNFTFPTGDTGPVPIIEMGTVTTGAAGSQASATLVPNGTTAQGVQKYLLNMTIPQGTPGTGSGNVKFNNTSVLVVGKKYAFKPTAAGSPEGDAVLLTNFEDYAVTSGSSTAYTATVTDFPSTLVAGAKAVIKAHIANTGTAPTLNVNGTGAKVIVRFDRVALNAGDMALNGVHYFIYDGTNWVLENPAISSNSAQLNNIPSSGFTRRYTLVNNADAKITYYLLGNAYDGTTVARTSLNGILTFIRGNITTIAWSANYHIAAISAYLANYGKVFSQIANGPTVEVVTLVYNSVKYLALKVSVASGGGLIFNGEYTKNGTNTDFQRLVDGTDIVSDVTVISDNNLNANATTATLATSSNQLGSVVRITNFETFDPRTIFTTIDAGVKYFTNEQSATGAPSAYYGSGIIKRSYKGTTAEFYEVYHIPSASSAGTFTPLYTANYFIAVSTGIVTFSGWKRYADANSSGVAISSNRTLFEGVTEVASVANIPISTQVVNATISANATLSVVAGLTPGRSIQLFITNSGAASIMVAIPTTGGYEANTATLTIPAGTTKEVNIICRRAGLYNLKAQED